jgi:hypothetical protein
MAVFDPGPSGIRASVDIQHDLATADWGPTGQLRIRIGLHQGPAQVRGDDFFGPTVNRAARLMGAGHGGQILLSDSVITPSELPEEWSLADMGSHRLRDLSEPVRVFQLLGPGLSRDFPALNTLDSAPNNLPTLASTFFGRENELADIRAHVRSGTRLTTLTGPGGTGKTRLALQAAADQTPHFRHGVFFVDLSTETDPEESFANIARVLGVDPAGDETALDTLCERLADRRLLLHQVNPKTRRRKIQRRLDPRHAAAADQNRADWPIGCTVRTAARRLFLVGDHRVSSATVAAAAGLSIKSESALIESASSPSSLGEIPKASPNSWVT